MNKLFLSAMAFASGVIVEKKFNVVERLMTACCRIDGKEIAQDAADEYEEEFEPAPSE